MTDKTISACGWAFLAVVALALLSWFVLVSNLHINIASSLRGQRSVQRALQQQFSNKVTFLYVVGVEGVGHHGVTPALATIARSCQHFVYYESQVLRAQQRQMSSTNYLYNLKNAKETRVLTAPTSEILIIEDSSFPTDSLKRHSNSVAKKSEGMYNLEWVYDNAKEAGLDIKFLYLNRDFYRTVMSHPEFDGDYQTHAQVLHDFVWYINEEYKRIEAKESGLWRQINYEWFSPMENCTSLVTSLIDFIGWTECDVEQACRIMQQELRPPTKRVVNETERVYVEQFNVSLPIPMLNSTVGGQRTFRPPRAHFLQPSSLQEPMSIPMHLSSLHQQQHQQHQQHQHQQQQQQQHQQQFQQQEPVTATAPWRSQPGPAVPTSYPRVQQEPKAASLHLRHRSYPAWTTHTSSDGSRRATRIGGPAPSKHQPQQV